MARMSVAEARGKMADAINRVAYAGERVVLERRGKGVAAMVSLEDLELLEVLEDRTDVAAARRAYAKMKQSGEEPRDWDEVKAELGL